MNCSKLEAALKAVLPKAVFHLEAPAYVERFIIWSESGYQTLRADDAVAEKVPLVNVFVYSQIEDDVLLESIMSALDDAGFPYTDPEQVFDEDRLILGWSFDCVVIPDG